MRWILPVALSLTLLEGLVRLVPYEPRIAAHVVFDPELGHKGPAGASVSTATSTLHYNAEGFRAVPPPPAGAKLKVAVLGDSITEAFTIDDEKLFASRLARLLPAEVRLYAAGDWGTTQELLAFRRYAGAWKPDVVLLQFTAVNDFLNNSPELAGRYQSRIDWVRPYFREGEITYLHPALHWLQAHSELARWLTSLTLSWVMPRIPPKGPDCLRDPHMRGVELYRVNPDESWRRMMAETRAIVEALRKSVAPARLVALFVPNPLELDPRLYGEVVEGQLHACYPQDPRPSPREGEKKFLEVFRGIETVSLYDAFAALERSGKDPFIYDGHLSEAGHEEAARVLSKVLRPPRAGKP